MSKAAFVIAFDGPGIEDGTIDVRDLAPALLALGQVVDAANRVLNGDRAPARVQAKAVSVGCFEVSLEVVISGWEVVRGYLLSDDLEGAKALLDWIGIIGGGGAVAAGTLKGVIGLYRWLAGRTPDSVIREGSSFRITIEGTTILVPAEVLKLYQDLAVNQAMNKLIESIENDRIDRIEFRGRPGEPAAQVLTAADRGFFSIPAPKEETIIDKIGEMALSIRSLAFQEGNKWRLFDGQNVITATIEDKDFLGRVDRSEIRFAKSDVLVCIVQTIQRRNVDGLKTEHIIKHVSEHKPAAHQINLF